MKTEIHEDKLPFGNHYTQPLATVYFKGTDYGRGTSATVILNSGKVIRIPKSVAVSKINPSSRRTATSAYIHEESNPEKVWKVSTIQHKGQTLIEIDEVSDEEIDILRLRKYINKKTREIEKMGTS